MKKYVFFMAFVILISMTAPAAKAAPKPLADPPQDLVEKVQDALKINTDTRGWLSVPGTAIDGLVVQDMESEEEAGKGSHFYSTHGFDKEENPLGNPYIDYRCQMRLGAMPRNTVIYGKSETDDPNGAGFSQLKKYLDDDFAAEHPYIYYSDGRNTYTFAVFAVFKTHMGLPYNVPDLNGAEMDAVLKTAQELSVREYTNQPSGTARILTLSTGVSFVDESETYMPPEYFRFVIMAKAVVPKTQ